MAEQTITLTEAKPGEPAVHLQFEPEIPLPAFIELEDADGTVHRYVPAPQVRDGAPDQLDLAEDPMGGWWSAADTPPEAAFRSPARTSTRPSGRSTGTS